MRSFIFALFCVHFVYAASYKAGVINSSKLSDIVQNVAEAGKKKVDVIVIASENVNSEENYDEILKDLSKAVRDAKLYLIASLKEKIRCQSKNEIVRSSIVFDRKGDIISIGTVVDSDFHNTSASATYFGIRSIYKNPSCTNTTTRGLTTFSSDFGVTFGLMMEEDLVMRTDDELDGVKDFIVVGEWKSDIPFLNAPQFLSSWSYTHKANVISSYGIYSGQAGLATGRGKLEVAEITNHNTATPNTPTLPQNTPEEDLGQYIIRPLDVEASSKGYNQVLCHNAFCCEFYIKTGFRASKQNDVNYGLAVFDGIRHFGSNQYIGTQNCAVFACAGLYKRSCSFGSVYNNTDVAFEKLTITANFTKHNSIQYPVILSNYIIPIENFNFATQNTKNTKQVLISLENSNNLLSFGIFGRDFNNDYKITEENNFGIYDYIFNDDVIDFFDYVWIRLRVLLFIVSIYVLEMM